jgi:hypothetical protein
MESQKKNKPKFRPNSGLKLMVQVVAVKALHHKDFEEGFGEVYIPEDLSRKDPKAGWEFPDFWKFKTWRIPDLFTSGR